MKQKVVMVILFSIFLFMFLFSIIISNNSKAKDKNSIAINASLNLSNKRIGWGIKRDKNHNQPELGDANKKLIEQNEGIAIGNPDKKYIYLTFDEGYEAGYTEKILDVLKENNVKATFFITGHYLTSAEDLVKRMIEENHIVGNHTYKHPSMPDLDNDRLKEEIMSLHTAVYEKFGYEMKYLRPPKGEFSERTLAYTKDLGYTTVMWSFAYEDWDVDKQGREEAAKKKILDNLHNGEVMLLHATSKDNSEILDSVIKKIKDEGYEFKSLDEFEK